MTERPIRVVVADDHALVREGIRNVLDSAGQIEVVGEASDGDQVEQVVAEVQPDVLVLDISMPGQSGLELTRALHTQHPELRIIILTMHDKQEYVFDAVRAGAHGYVLKDGDPAELKRAIEVVHEGDAFFTPWAAAQISAALRGEKKPGAEGPLSELSVRETEILREVARGRTNREIGEQLGISPRTVESHRTRIMDKLEIRTIAGLTRFAIENGVAESD
jgi:two-component system, NarL family, response regulator LiaR